MADTVRIDETAQQAVAAYAQEHSVSLARAATQLILGNITSLSSEPLQAPFVLAQKSAPTLDEAAEVMLRHLPAALVEKLRELCSEYRVSPAAYLLSYAKLADDRGELSINLSSDDRELGNAPVPIPVPEIAQCAYCKADFKPARVNQKFCQEPEDWSIASCGRRALLEELHKRRPPEAQRKNIAARHTEKLVR